MARRIRSSSDPLTGWELLTYCPIVVLMWACVYLALFGSGNVVMP